MKRVPPNDIEAEQAILASMLVNGAIIPQGIAELKAEDFYQLKHQCIFSAIKSLFRNRSNADLVTVSAHLKQEGSLDEAGGAVYIAGLTSGVISSSIKDYVTIVKEKASARNLIGTSQRLIDSCFAGAPIDEVTNQAGAEFLKIGKADTKKSAKICDVADDVMERLKGIQRGEIDPMGVESGFKDLDNLLLGFQKSDLIILAGRPSMGKTTLAMNMVMNAAQNHKKSLVFSLEMPKERLVQNQLSSLSGATNTAIQMGYVQGTQWTKVSEAHKQLSKLPIRIDDSSTLHISNIQARAKMFAMTEGVDLIVVDYLQLIKGNSKSNREREVSEISAGLKALAKDLNVPVIALSQLSRSCENRDNKRPLMSDLRDSGSIEQDADVIAFVYRDEVYNTEASNPLKGQAELLIRKNRCGEQGKVKLLFDGARCRFDNVPEEEKIKEAV